MNPSHEPGPRSSQTQSGSGLLPRLRLRTRFLLSMLLITTGLTSTSLLLVQRSIRSNVRQSIAVNLRNSVAAFQDFRLEREPMLTNDVALLADLPITRAIMTSAHPLTIQDASQDSLADRGQRSFCAGRSQRSSRRAAYQDARIYTRGRGKVFPAVAGGGSRRIKPLVAGRAPSLSDFYRAHLSRHPNRGNSARLPRHWVRDEQSFGSRSQQSSRQRGGIFLRE